MEITEKRCCRCNEVKNIDNFHIKSDSKDGYDGRCKDCKRQYNNKWRKENLEKARSYDREYVRNQRKDPVKRMFKNIMSRSSKCKIRNGFKVKHSYKEILGCSLDELKDFIENQFDDKMNWDNYGKYWEIDHEIPLFRCNDIQDYVVLNHYTNLRPLEVKRNRNFYKYI